MFGHNAIVLNSFDTIYEALVTQANNFAGREKTYRFKAIFSNSPDVLLGDFTPKWIYMKKTAMQVLKVRKTGNAKFFKLAVFLPKIISHG